MPPPYTSASTNNSALHVAAEVVDNPRSTQVGSAASNILRTSTLSPNAATYVSRVQPTGMSNGRSVHGCLQHGGPQVFLRTWNNGNSAPNVFSSLFGPLDHGETFKVGESVGEIGSEQLD